MPIADAFFAALAAYREGERPSEATTDTLFLVDSGPFRDGDFTKDHWRDRLERARLGVGIERLGGRRLRETGLQCLRAGGMHRDALRMQTGHQPRSGRSARWHWDEYQRVAPCLAVLLPPGADP